MSNTQNIAPYILWWNDKAYNIDKELFSRFSKKFRQLVNDPEKPLNKNQMDIEVYNEEGNKISEETFIAFINACQLKPFEVNRHNVFDLQFLASADQWNVKSLSAYIDEYINKNQIEQTDEVNYIDILLDKIAAGTDSYKDWCNVARRIKSSIKDDAFKEIPPDVIYEILDIAERNGDVLGRELNEFIMDLLPEKPNTAIPLLLRANFDYFKPEDIMMIYHEPLVHSMNINFFLASALSALQNKNTATIAKSKRSQELEFKCLEISIDKMCEERQKKLQLEYKDQVDEIKDEIYRQQAIIDKLCNRIDEHKKRVELAEKKQNKRRKPIEQNCVDEVDEEVKDQLEMMADEINDALNKHADKINNHLSKAEETANKRFKDSIAKSNNEINRVQNELEKLFIKGREMDETLDAVDWQLQEARKAFCAKVTLDKIRFDKYLRKTTNKFRIFDNDPQDRIFNLGSADLKPAEEFLVNVDNHINSYCPLRQQELSPSPKPSPRQQRKKH